MTETIQHLISKQINRWDLERKASAEAQRKEEEGLRLPATGKPALTISRQRGTRGKQLAGHLAHELAYGLFDREIIDYVAHHMGVRSELVESLDEHDRSEMEFWFRNLMSQRVFDHDAYAKALGEVIKALSLQGGVVILGRGGNFMLQRENHAYHVRLVAPIEFRVQTLQEQEGMNERDAHHEIEQTDKARANFVKRYFHQDINDPCAYDLTINMAHTQLDPAVKIITSALRARGWTMNDTGGDKRRRSS